MAEDERGPISWVRVQNRAILHRRGRGEKKNVPSFAFESFDHKQSCGPQNRVKMLEKKKKEILEKGAYAL